MLLVGVTGALGAGKSTVARQLAVRGAFVIDADQVARQVLAPGSDAERMVLEHFGPGVRSADGRLDRRALARVAFSSQASRQELESLTHPLIRHEIARKVAAAAAPIVVVELPLLDRDRRREYNLDAVVHVVAATSTALGRAVGRGMSLADARSRAAAQPSEHERAALADYTLVNEGPIEDVASQVEDLWRWLCARAGVPAGHARTKRQGPAAGEPHL